MSEFRINDKRSSARPGKSGIITGQSVADAKRLSTQASRAALEAGRGGSVPADPALSRSMAVQRLKTGSVGGGAGQVSFATQRPRDPFFYWQQNNLPFDFEKPEERMKLRQLCRHIYDAHSVMASAIDVYSKWPLTGMKFDCKDKEIEQFYTDLFFDRLDYEDFLQDLGREYWVTGEAFPLGSFNETLGIWDDDELLNPDDVFVEKSPFIKEPNLFIRLPESLRRVLTTGQPAHEYQMLMRSYPELKAFAQENTRMPVSGILLKQLAFKTSAFASRGMPIMYRALRPLMQEEMLNSAQDAIADRLYTPLILAKIGASATDLGTQEPWVPTMDQISDFESSLDMALAADFRVLTTHFAVDMSTVFGRETMPNFDQDFERLMERELQAFGLSKTMLSGAGSGETFAADAMNRDLVTQLLSTFQRRIRRFVEDRMRVVAEAQGHFDYEVRGGKRFPIMEEVLEVDEETGEQRIVEQPKLLIPEIHFKSMSMQDEDQQRQFLDQLRAEGVPISQERRLVNIDLDLDKEREKVAEEQVELAVQAQKVRQETYRRLKAENLPIPQDLKDDFEPKALQPGQPAAPAAIPARVPLLGVDDQDSSALVPTPDMLAIPPGDELGLPAGPGGTMPPEANGPGAQVIPLPRNRMSPESGSNHNPDSDIYRKHMPKPAAKYLRDAEGNLKPLVNPDTDEQINAGMVFGPRHVGMSRHAGIQKHVSLDDAFNELADEPLPFDEAGP